MGFRSYVHAMQCAAPPYLVLTNAGNQVTPFDLKTPDGEILFAWHVLPLPVYLQNEASMAKQTPGFADDITTTESFKLLREDPEARLVLYCKLLLAPLSIPGSPANISSPRCELLPR